MKSVHRLLPSWFAILILTVLFVLSSLFARHWLGAISTLIDINKDISISLYLLTLVIETVLAPVSAIPLIPIASAMWGPYYAGWLTLLGWTIGSLIAFWIGHGYGRQFLSKFTDFNKLDTLIELLSGSKRFYTILLLRFLIPADFVSYALSLVPSVSTPVYIITTIIGYAPHAFLWAYVGALPLTWQLIWIICGAITLIFIWPHLVKSVKRL